MNAPAHDRFRTFEFPDTRGAGALIVTLSVVVLSDPENAIK